MLKQNTSKRQPHLRRNSPDFFPVWAHAHAHVAHVDGWRRVAGHIRLGVARATPGIREQKRGDGKQKRCAGHPD